MRECARPATANGKEEFLHGVGLPPYQPAASRDGRNGSSRSFISSAAHPATETAMKAAASVSARRRERNERSGHGNMGKRSDLSARRLLHNRDCER